MPRSVLNSVKRGGYSTLPANRLAMLVANGRPSGRIQPVVEAPTCVAALIVLVAIHAFQFVPPRNAALAELTQKASAPARLEPMLPGTMLPLVANTRFILGRK